MLLILVPGQGYAAPFTVNSTVDAVDANIGDGICQTATAGQCTLRAAVQEANAPIGVADTIFLPAGTYTLTIVSTLTDTLGADGDLDTSALGGTLTITGAGAATTIIDGGALDRVFETHVAGTATISGVTIRNGLSNDGLGGCVSIDGGTTMMLSNVVVTACRATAGGGGGIDNTGALTMNTVAVTNNTSTSGGIDNGAAGTVTWTNGTLSGNNDLGFHNNGTITLMNVTISGNGVTTPTNGAGLDNNGTATLINCTVTGNRGIQNAPPTNVGGIRATGQVSVRNTIIADNTPTNCGAAANATPLTSLGNNLDRDATCLTVPAAGDLTGIDPLLAVLADNGGAVQTHALLIGSPAIDTGATGTAVCPPTDARGIVARPVDGNVDGLANCDIGAFEFRPQKIVGATPPLFDFGPVTFATTVDHVITLTNGGDGDLVLATVAAANPLAAPFSIAAETCSGLTLKLIPVPAANSCTITTRFAPTNATPATDSFDIPSNDPVTPAVSLTLSGVGTTAPVPGLVVTDSFAPNNDRLLPFGAVAINAAADATVTISNTGSANLLLGTIASADPLAAPFTITSNTCSGASIAPTASCTLTVHFAPTANTELSDTFDIPVTNVAGTTSITMTVTGSGISATGNHAPSIPVLVDPANGQTGVPTTMTFVWNKSVDPDGDAVTYQFHNCTDSTFAAADCAPATVASAPGLWLAGLGSFGAGIILIGFVAKGGTRRSRMTMLVIALLLASGALFMSCSKSSDETPPATGTTAGQISNTVRNLTPNTIYYWKVVADDGKGGTSSSAVSSYTTGQ